MSTRLTTEDLLTPANAALLRAFPPSQQVASAGRPELRGGGDALYDTALMIMNEQSSSSEDSRIVGVATSGALASLDPHSSYMDASAFRDMQVQTRGTFGGLGLEVTMENGLVKVVSPIDGTPAQKAGVLANDVIVSIDDTSVQGLTLNDAVTKMRGPVGAAVRLKVIRPNREQPFEVTIVRDTIRVRSVRWRVEESDVGYIRITTFNEQTSDGLKQAIADIGTQTANNNLKGYVIDLRNNPGGLLSEAVSVVDTLLERGEIVSTRGRNPQDGQRFSAKPGDLSKGKPIIVLINGGSAAAIGDRLRRTAGHQASHGGRHALVRQGIGPDDHSAGRRERRIAADDSPVTSHPVRNLDPGQGDHAGHRGPAGRA